MFFSIIVPVYNAERFLGEAIDSILRQTYKDFEIIVIDDGSTDDTAKVVSKFEDVRYIYQEHLGVSVARNRGIAESKGEYITFADRKAFTEKWNPVVARIKSKRIPKELQQSVSYY